MSIPKTQTRRHAAETQPRKSRRSSPDSLTTLPMPIIEQIVICCSSPREKRALRKTCKLFQQMLDSSMTCINLQTRFNKDLYCLESFLGRMHMLRAVNLKTYFRVGRFLQFLPCQIRTLSVHSADYIDLRKLRRLTCLESLSLNTDIVVQGIEYISGLTYLHCRGHVQKLDQLTNLEVLQVDGYVPTGFFTAHRQLPLSSICIRPSACEEFFCSAKDWDSAPPTLTRLALGNGCTAGSSWPAALPTTLTRLQLLVISDECVKQAATALPGLLRLDLHICAGSHSLNGLSKFTNLQSLGMCIGRGDVPCGRGHVFSGLPAIARAVRKGVQLHVTTCEDELLDVFRNPSNLKSEWESYF